MLPKNEVFTYHNISQLCIYHLLKSCVWITTIQIMIMQNAIMKVAMRNIKLSLASFALLYYKEILSAIQREGLSFVPLSYIFLTLVIYEISLPSSTPAKENGGKKKNSPRGSKSKTPAKGIFSFISSYRTIYDIYIQ